jgi:hypothetical protein
MLSSMPFASAVGEQLFDRRGVDRVDVTDEAVVDFPGRAVGVRHRRALVRVDQAGVDAADADRLDREFPADGEDLRVDQAVQHHRARLDRLLIGDAASGDHPGLDAEGGLDAVELRSTAVDQHGLDAHLMQDRDLFDQRARRVAVGEGRAARLDDEDFALVHANVGGRAFQGAHRDGGIRSTDDHV